MTGPVYVYAATVVRVVDADTLYVEVDLGLDVRVDAAVRLAGVDAPELKTKPGRDARAFVMEWLMTNCEAVPGRGWAVVVETIKDRREKYGRYLAVVHPVADRESKSSSGPDLASALVAAGHARAYDGGRRT